jgi:hypothetical protein
VGCIVSPDPDLLSNIQNIMTNFVTGTCRISKDRLFTRSEKGGIGLINVKNLITGLQAAWAKKAFVSTRDPWRVDLHNISCGNCYTLNPNYVDMNWHPVLHTIAGSFSDFAAAYFKKNDNYKEMFVFRNSLLKRGRL